ncbi:hypothetical protein E3Q22_02446 [Wallemia mellicola]|uniref:BZIP domain-containing protein n=1 Tax=Wallemia mellicola TaxID=1708541 RepID=A0A4T0PKB6_9BASI|nr:hypothetical protein E3Q24_02256 [Wallemia mellicola]TIB75823.1 hypothetical protein E3Q23_02216 [Wallemia mellicola]TIB78698.1 hypothetical protein E3Q22_02446 [Wallemia mellicola]TIB84166.1 hypothetical protein E3Q21_02478 [Wallemia mellicola]TIB87308.1 hypothetical protein E3Q20_02471 [Wallemia mellicola]
MSFTLENFDLGNFLASEVDAFSQTGANLKNPHGYVDYDNFQDFLSPRNGQESLDSDLPYSWFDYNRNQPQIKTEPISDIVPVESLPPSMFFQPPTAFSQPVEQSKAQPHEEAQNEAQDEAHAQPEELPPSPSMHPKDEDYNSDEESDATAKPTPKRAPRRSAAAGKSKQKAIGSPNVIDSPQNKRKRSLTPLPATSSRRSSVMDTEMQELTNNSTIELPKIQKTAHSSQFVPPDTSNLPKREARLLKNRAAAFLSRQRKREAFELLEEKVIDLEKEKQQLQLERDTAIAGERRMLEELRQLQAQFGQPMQQ